MTPAKRWAMKRNGTKWRVAGLRATLQSLASDPVSVPSERRIFKKLSQAVGDLLELWDGNNAISKKQFMKGE